jgi:hypothetical protein
LAFLRNARLSLECPFTGVDPKSLMYGQTNANDPGCVKTSMSDECEELLSQLRLQKEIASTNDFQIDEIQTEFLRST